MTSFILLRGQQRQCCPLSRHPSRMWPMPCSQPTATVCHAFRNEMMKAVGERYPSNMEAVGIEMIVRAELPKGFKPPRKQEDLPLDKLRGRFGIYPNPTEAQNRSLTWLVEALQYSMKLAPSEVFKHPEVSRKNVTEAGGANWTIPTDTP